MKCRMVVSGLLCLWAVSQVTMPPSAEAGKVSWRDDLTKIVWTHEWGPFHVDPGLGSDSNSGRGTSVTERNAPNPAVCKGGYRWGRVTPDDFITKIYC